MSFYTQRWIERLVDHVETDAPTNPSGLTILAIARAMAHRKGTNWRTGQDVRVSQLTLAREADTTPKTIARVWSYLETADFLAFAGWVQVGTKSVKNWNLTLAKVEPSTEPRTYPVPKREEPSTDNRSKKKEEKSVERSSSPVPETEPVAQSMLSIIEERKRQRRLVKPAIEEGENSSAKAEREGQCPECGLIDGRHGYACAMPVQARAGKP
jgi:hypothetical protein